MSAKRKQLKKVEMYGEVFFIDFNHDLVCKLISDKYQEPASLIDELFFQGPQVVLRLIDIILQDECVFDDVAMIFFLSMALQNYGEFEKAGIIITKMYNKHSSDLLAKCAFANHLLFNARMDEIPPVFNDDFDLAKLTNERKLPLPTFVHFISLACEYYLHKGDGLNFGKTFSYLLEVAPEHETTQNLLSLINDIASGKSSKVN